MIASTQESPFTQEVEGCSSSCDTTHSSHEAGAHREDETTMSDSGLTGVAMAVTQSECPTSTPRNRSVSVIFAHLLSYGNGQQARERKEEVHLSAVKRFHNSIFQTFCSFKGASLTGPPAQRGVAIAPECFVFEDSSPPQAPAALQR
jgi:hypothetical protein